MSVDHGGKKCDNFYPEIPAFFLVSPSLLSLPILRSIPSHPRTSSEQTWEVQPLHLARTQGSLGWMSPPLARVKAHLLPRREATRLMYYKPNTSLSKERPSRPLCTIFSIFLLRPCVLFEDQASQLLSLNKTPNCRDLAFLFTNWIWPWTS